MIKGGKDKNRGIKQELMEGWSVKRITKAERLNNVKTRKRAIKHCRPSPGLVLRGVCVVLYGVCILVCYVIHERDN